MFRGYIACICRHHTERTASQSRWDCCVSRKPYTRMEVEWRRLGSWLHWLLHGNVALAEVWGCRWCLCRVELWLRPWPRKVAAGVVVWVWVVGSIPASVLWLLVGWPGALVWRLGRWHHVGAR